MTFRKVRRFVFVTIFVGLNGCAFVPDAREAYNWNPGAQVPGGWTVFRDSSRYRGGLEKGVPNGHGKYVSTEGHKYSGDFRKGLYHGNGHIQYIGGEQYKGQFINGEFSGNGRYNWKSGLVYDGQWRAGKVEGNGTYMDAAGIGLEGQFSGVSLTGVVTAKFKGGKKKGYVLQDEWNRYWREHRHLLKKSWREPESKNKKADQISFDLKRYFLPFGLTPSPEKQDRNTVVMYVYKDGSFYIGGWDQNKGRSGKGKYYLADQKTFYDGWWENDRFVKGSHTRSGVTHKGEWNGFTVDGYARELKSGKLVYEGEFKNGKRDGAGVCFEEAPVDCFYQNGKRVDTAYIAKSFNTKLRDVVSGYESKIQQLNDRIEAQKKSFEKEWNRKISALRRQLQSYKNQQTAVGMLDVGLAVYQGNDDAARAKARDVAAKINRKENEIQNAKREFARELSQREQQWSREKTRRITELAANYKQAVDQLFAREEQACNSMKTHSWESSSALCVYSGRAEG